MIPFRSGEVARRYLVERRCVVQTSSPLGNSPRAEIPDPRLPVGDRNELDLWGTGSEENSDQLNQRDQVLQHNHEHLGAPRNQIFERSTSVR
jgi:hypothetical protein